jgi:hypothetical protein
MKITTVQNTFNTPSTPKIQIDGVDVRRTVVMKCVVDIIYQTADGRLWVDADVGYIRVRCDCDGKVYKVKIDDIRAKLVFDPNSHVWRDAL